MSEKITKRWIVLRADARGAGPGFPWFDTRSGADEEARGLASRFPGIRYIIMETVGTVMAPRPNFEIEDVSE